MQAQVLVYILFFEGKAYVCGTGTVIPVEKGEEKNGE